MGGAAVGAAGFLGYGLGSAINRNFIDGTQLGDQIGKAVANAIAAIGVQEAKQALEVNVHLDGQQIASSVQETYGRYARRN